MSKINLKNGDYSAVYFHKTQQIMQQVKPNHTVTLQFFQRQDDVMLGGIEESLQILKDNTDTSQYRIKYLPDGSIINNKDIVLEISGAYQHFGLYEGVIDGVLARGTSLATNAYRVMSVANGKPVIYMGDRADHYLLQSFDGKAIALAGMSTQVTHMHVKDHAGHAVGTMPHALIQMFNGSTLDAAIAYHDTFPDEKLSVLVDFENDVIKVALEVLAHFNTALDSVRVDTSIALSDRYFDDKQQPEYGVTANLVRGLRDALDTHQGQHVKIIVSSGFDAAKIAQFEAQNVPVDVYGVGASLLKIGHSFTADAVKIDGELLAKVGRAYNPSNHLLTY